MKRVLVMLPLLGLLLLCASPVYAADPPDLNVVIAAVTPGDVDLDVGITAGGSVDVTVDGVDFKETANTANQALSGVQDFRDNTVVPPINVYDWIELWKKFMEPHIQQIDDMWGTIGVVADAEVKLIQNSERVNEEISALQSDLSQLQGISTALQARDETIWNQLMYGAEAHIAILQDVATLQEQRIAQLEQENNNLLAKMDAQETRLDALSHLPDYIEEQRNTFVSYILALVVVSCVLCVGLACALFKSFGAR